MTTRFLELKPASFVFDSRMSENNSNQVKKSFSPDWFVRGILTRLGDAFDKFTGRNWKPSSSLATSELVERLKKLLDAEVKDAGGRGKFVPHIIKLKMQWNKFSTDAADTLKTLENELLTAAVDHINDNRYHTYAPLKIEVKPDYFTEGVRLTASFDEAADDEQEAAVKVTMPEMSKEHLLAENNQSKDESETFVAEFSIGGKQKNVALNFPKGKRLSVGRTRENDLTIGDQSVSKIHAALFVNAENKLLVADAGSTNGTYLNGERIAYGRAVVVGDGDKIKFGSVDVFLRRAPRATEFVTREDAAPDDEFKTNKDIQNADEFAKTQNIISIKQGEE
ncbi:MAG: FHA domain-containing protein [Pyrinomonadaceae bacterium]